MNGNHQLVSVDNFFNNDVKYLQRGILTMTYTTSIKKKKATQYDLLGIKDMVSNIWSPVKVAYDKHAMWVTRVEVMRKHGYGYLRENEKPITTFTHSRKATSHDSVSMTSRTCCSWLFRIGLPISQAMMFYDFSIALPDIRKKDTYTPYQDPQGFIYVENLGRNKLMHLDELYKFGDVILTRLRTSLDDITKNIIMEYLPQRRWSSLEKKKAHIMIKAIDKQLKERRMMRSFEKFVSGRHYRIDL
nr:hypothetical protein [Tanacetum cinerariifolium]